MGHLSTLMSLQAEIVKFVITTWSFITHDVIKGGLFCSLFRKGSRKFSGWIRLASLLPFSCSWSGDIVESLDKTKQLPWLVVRDASIQLRVVFSCLWPGPKLTVIALQNLSWSLFTFLPSSAPKVAISNLLRWMFLSRWSSTVMNGQCMCIFSLFCVVIWILIPSMEHSNPRCKSANSMAP